MPNTCFALTQRMHHLLTKGSWPHSICHTMLAGPGCSWLDVKQMHGYSDWRTCSGGTVRGLERGDLQQHSVPRSYQRSVATIQGHDTEKTSIWRLWVKTLWSAKKISAQKLIAHMIPMLKLTFLPHFLQIQLARCYQSHTMFVYLSTNYDWVLLYLINFSSLEGRK